MALLHFWKTNREIVLSQTVQQVVSNAGDGNLRDGGVASQEFREFLTLAPSEALFNYARQCLENPFTKSGCVLQDIVNEFGRRLDFDAEDGLYQGKRNAIGFDGIWRSQVRLKSSSKSRPPMHTPFASKLQMSTRWNWSRPARYPKPHPS
jgi:hypothetical protein